MTRTNQHSFMARVHEALEHSRTMPAPPAPLVDDATARLASDDGNTVELFCRRATEVGLKIHRTSAANLANDLLAKLRELNAQTVAIGLSPSVENNRLQATLGQAWITAIDWKSARSFAPLYDIDAGITDVHAALAETGTLVCHSDADHGRGLSLAPPIHIAIVRKADILPDMLDYWKTVPATDPTAMPSSIAFITGPSKTADIEGILITGVHGPGQVHVFVVEG